MKTLSIALILFSLLVTAPSLAPAQTAPGINTPIGPLARTIVGIDVIKAQIAALRRQLASCDAPGANKPDACASRALLLAKLNYLLEVSAYLGDPDAAGTPPPKPIPPPTPKPGETSDYEKEIPYLEQQLQQEVPPRIYLMSENRAKLLIIRHCERMKSPYPILSAVMTDADQVQARADQASGKTKAAIATCIKEYDAKQIVANRKMALEYCLPAASQEDGGGGGRTTLNLCLHRHDMLQAMCKQQLDLQVALEHRKDPPKPHATQACPLFPMSPADFQAIKAAPPVPAMAPLPPKFFAPPDVVIPPRTPLPIPAGTVVELTIQGSWNGNNIDNVTLGLSTITAVLPQPLVIGGKTVLDQYTGFRLKGRIIGQDDAPVRPDLVQIGLSLDEVKIDKLDAQGQPHCPCDRYADVTSNELVFTVSYVLNANKPTVRFDSRLRFTIGGSGSVDGLSAQPPAPGRRGAAPPTPAAPQTPAAPVPAAPATPDPQQRAEEARKRSERIQACVQQAIVNNPAGLAQSTAIAACAQAK